MTGSWLHGVNLYLVGMMGAGKTTLGKPLAAQLGYRFFDTDGLIEQVAGQPVSTIFAEQGESAFRDLESQVLANLSAYSRLVVATGGGIVTQQMNWSYLRHGLVVWLDVPVTELAQRLAGNRDRPLLQTADPVQTLMTILNQRQHLYAQADVHVQVPPNLSTAALVITVLEQIQSVLKQPAERRQPPGSTPSPGG